MIKSIFFTVLTKFFHFNELKILRQQGYLFFLGLTNNVYICEPLKPFHLQVVSELLFFVKTACMLTYLR